MTFTSAAQGAEFSYEVKKDNSSAIDAIKSFVEDYNKIIEEVYGQLDQKPNSGKDSGRTDIQPVQHGHYDKR